MTHRRYSVIAGFVVCASTLLLAGCGGSSSSSGSSGSSSSGSGSGSGGSTTYTIGGSVSGLASGQSVTLTDNGGNALPVSANGSFAFSTALASGAGYAVAVQSSSSGITCQATNASGTVGTANVTNVAVTCTANAPQRYTVGGTLTGLAAGASVTLLDNGADALSLTANGSFAFSQSEAAGSAYSVTVGAQPSGQTCAVSGGTGTIGSANITGVTVSCAAAGSPETVLYRFGQSATDATLPIGGVLLASNGSLYGATQYGGTHTCSTVGKTGCGTVFQLTPTGTGTYRESILYSFGANATDAEFPTSSLTADASGDLFGTSSEGGSTLCGGSGCGTVYELRPTGSGSYTESVIYSFGVSSTDGASPQGRLALDSAGNLYGETFSGGLYGEGTVFKLAPSGSGAYQESILYSFGANSTDGAKPDGGVILDSAGNLYGTTREGGGSSLCNSVGCGTVFRLSPSGSETILYAFGQSTVDGRAPAGGLVMDSAGALYGATLEGGSQVCALGCGTLFKLSPTGSSLYSDSTLYDFSASTGSDGVGPQGRLLLDSAGNLFGTTFEGGTFNQGTVFMVSASGTESILYNFGASTGDGSDSLGDLTQDSSGNLYGVTDLGGITGTTSGNLALCTGGCGTVFEIAH